MSTTSLLRHLVLDNPMTLEATRVWRRFIRSGGDTGKGVNFTALVFVVVLYVWCLVAIVRYREDMTQVLLTLEAIVLTLVVPGSMYAAVSGERERLTWDGLVMTSLSPGQIVVGKLLWRVALILGIAALFLPPLLLCHYGTGLLGNGRNLQMEYSLGDLLLSQGINITWGLLMAGYSLWISTKTKRTITTLSIVAITLLSFLVLVPLLVGLFGGHNYWYAFDPPLVQLGSLMMHLHPFDSIWQLVGYNPRPTPDLWVQLNLVRSVPLIYGGCAVVCVLGAWKTLRGLEEPRVRS